MLSLIIFPVSYITHSVKRWRAVSKNFVKNVNSKMQSVSSLSGMLKVVFCCFFSLNFFFFINDILHFWPGKIAQ